MRADRPGRRDAYSCCRLLSNPVAAEIEELALAWSNVFGSCRFRRKSILENIFVAGPANNAIFAIRAHKKTKALNKVHPDSDNSITVSDSGTPPCACFTPSDNTSVYRRVKACEGWCSWSAYKKTIGFIHIQAAADKPIWYNRGIGVLPFYRQHGVGSELLRAAVNYARSHGAVAIISYTDKENNAALALHLRLGFTADYSSPVPRSELRRRLLLEL